MTEKLCAKELKAFKDHLYKMSMAARKKEASMVMMTKSCADAIAATRQIAKKKNSRVCHALKKGGEARETKTQKVFRLKYEKLQETFVEMAKTV